MSAVATPLEQDAPGCLYPLTATPPLALPRLSGHVRVDVAVVGGGYTGLSAALHLAERGRQVALLEAFEPGWGAAGRNGGQVNAGMKHEPDAVELALGPVHGPRVVELAGGAPQLLFDLIERHGIDCEATRAGTLRAVYQPRQLATLRASADQWRRRGVELELWDATRLAEVTGSRRYVGATFDRRGGAVNPLSLSRGLAQAAQRCGAAVFGESPARRLEPARPGWRVHADGGVVTADAVIIATDGYSDGLWPGLRTSIVPIYSSIIATEPLPAPLRASILPGGPVLYEAGNVTVYYRCDAAGRLLMGGRGLQRRATQRADYQHLVAYALRLWPALSGVRWTHWWNGQFALTPDFYPRLHVPAPGVYVGLGYSGRGVALGTALGAELAAAATGTPLAALSLPATPIPTLRFHRYWRLGVAAGVAIGRLRDRLGR